MRQCGPVNVVVRFPSTDIGQQELSRRVASIHADTVNMQLRQLSCPTPQKLQLLDAIIADIKCAR